MQDIFEEQGSNIIEATNAKRNIEDYVYDPADIDDPNFVSPLDIEETIPPITMQKGYLNIKNPLVFDTDLGSWSATALLGSENNHLIRALRKSSGKPLSQEQTKRLSDLMERAEKISEEYIFAPNEPTAGEPKYIDSIAEEIKRVLAHSQINKDLQNFIKDLGFDGIQYKNTVETPLEGESFHSYIAFDPEQFKSITSKAFDPSDKRSAFYEGGEVIAEKLGISKEDLEWAKSQRKRFPERESYDGIGDAAAHLALGFVTKRAERPTAALFAANARELVTLDFVGRKMDVHNNNLGAQIKAKDFKEAEKVIDKLIKDRVAIYMTPAESRARRGYSKGGGVYNVKAGDTLSRIAKDNNTTVSAIMAVNDIENADLIFVDQAIKLPIKERSKKPVVQAVRNNRRRKNRIDSKTLEALKTKKAKNQNKITRTFDFLSGLRKAANTQVVDNFTDFFNPFQGDKTEKDYKPEVIDALKFAASSALSKGKMFIDYGDYNLKESNVRAQVASPKQRKRDKLEERMLKGDITPTEEAAFSVGGATLTIEDGDVYVNDIYDFSKLEETISNAIPDRYSKLRKFVGNLELPMNKFKSKIKLGKVEEFNVG